MYTSYIGKKFLEYYKHEYDKSNDYTAEQFFDEIMFPLFFDDKRHLMHVGNSPFFQKVSDKDLKLFGCKSLSQINRFKEKVKGGDYGGDLLVGYGSSDNTATTSGQLSNLKSEYDSEDIYNSWIGQALSIGVKGGYANLIDDKTILLELFKGWELYSKLLNQSDGLKDKQIETWNGNYLIQILNNQGQDFNYLRISIENTLGKLAIQTIQWTELIFELCKFYKKDILTSYCYILSQTNTTIGFINIYLKEVRKMYELRDMLIIDGKDTVLTDNQIDSLIPFYGFKEACMQGTIGLKSIEPKGLRKYIPKGSYMYSQGNDLDLEKETNYFIYKLWILAMLNKQELLDLSREFASILEKAVKEIKDANRSKTTDRQFIRELFESKTSKQFIDKTIEIIDENNSELLRKLVEEVIILPKDNFPLLLTLIKFEYTILSKKDN